MKTILTQNEGQTDDKIYFSKCLKEYINQLSSIDKMCDAMVENWYE